MRKRERCNDDDAAENIDMQKLDNKFRLYDEEQIGLTISDSVEDAWQGQAVKFSATSSHLDVATSCFMQCFPSIVHIVICTTVTRAPPPLCVTVIVSKTAFEEKISCQSLVLVTC